MCYLKKSNVTYGYFAVCNFHRANADHKRGRKYCKHTDTKSAILSVCSQLMLMISLQLMTMVMVMLIFYQ